MLLLLIEYFVTLDQLPTRAIVFVVCCNILFSVWKTRIIAVESHGDRLLSEIMNMANFGDADFGSVERKDEVCNDRAVIMRNSACDDVYNNGLPECKRKSYVAKLVNIGKAKFGLMTLRVANRNIVRKFLYEECVKHGLRPSHISRILDLATNLVFIPSKFEVESVEVLASQRAAMIMRDFIDLSVEKENQITPLSVQDN